MGAERIKFSPIESAETNFSENRLTADEKELLGRIRASLSKSSEDGRTFLLSVLEFAEWNGYLTEKQKTAAEKTLKWRNRPKRIRRVTGIFPDPVIWGGDPFDLCGEPFEYADGGDWFGCPY